MISRDRTLARRLPRVVALGLAAVLVLGVGVAPAAAQQTPGAWIGGPFAAGDNTYQGFIDLPAAGATVAAGQTFDLKGWIVDTTAQGWAGIDEVDVYDGLAGQGPFLGKATIATSRPDVASALGNPFWAGSGFAFTVPATLSQGAHTLTVYAHTPGKGWWYKQVAVTVGGATSSTSTTSATAATGVVNVITNVKFNDVIYAGRDYPLMGYALDTSANVAQAPGIDRVEVWVDGPRNQGTYLGKAELKYWSEEAIAKYGSQFGAAGWRLTFSPTIFHEGGHNLYVYARSSLSGQETRTQQFFRIEEGLPPQ